MKKLLYILLLVSNIGYSQVGGISGACAKLPQTRLWSAQCSTKESVAWMNALDILIRGEVFDGDWFNYDLFFIYATGIQANARISIVNPNYGGSYTVLTEVNSPTWTANSGYTFNGTSQYLNTNYKIGTNSVHLAVNHSSLGAYSQTNNTNAGFWGCHTSGYFGLELYASGAFNPCNFDNGTVTFTNASGTAGYFSATQAGSSKPIAYRKSTQLVNSAWATGYGTVNLTFYFGANNSNGTPANYDNRKYSLFNLGDENMNQLQQYNNIQAFATSIGFNN